MNKERILENRNRIYLSIKGSFIDNNIEKLIEKDRMLKNMINNRILKNMTKLMLNLIFLNRSRKRNSLRMQIKRFSRVRTV